VLEREETARELPITGLPVRGPTDRNTRGVVRDVALEGREGPGARVQPPGDDVDVAARCAREARDHIAPPHAAAGAGAARAVPDVEQLVRGQRRTRLRLQLRAAGGVERDDLNPVLAVAPERVVVELVPRAR